MEKSKSILVIDDEPSICDFIEDLLMERFNVSKAHNAREGLSLATTLKPDLVILDIKLSDASGLDLCQTLRREMATKHIPILIYSGSEDVDALTDAFERGADDFVPKSARPRELVARVTAKIRRLDERAEKEDTITCGNLVLDNLKLEARLEGRRLTLSVLEYNLLRFFVINRERVMSRAQILQGVWKDSVVSNRTIDTHMVYLRKKLSGFDHHLATIYGAGYILRAGGAPTMVDENEMVKSDSEPTAIAAARAPSA